MVIGENPITITLIRFLTRVWVSCTHDKVFAASGLKH